MWPFKLCLLGFQKFNQEILYLILLGQLKMLLNLMDLALLRTIPAMGSVEIFMKNHPFLIFELTNYQMLFFEKV